MTWNLFGANSTSKDPTNLVGRPPSVRRRRLCESGGGDAIDYREDARRTREGYGEDGGYCAAYLDDYLARASQTAGTATTTVPGQQYFLVPVTVEVAQQPVYVD